MSTELEILGCSGGFPELGEPCSGYLVKTEQGTLLMDCGPGIAGAIFADSKLHDLDAILISHLHPDHVLDLMPLAYGLLVEWISEGHTKSIPVHVPRGGKDFLRRFSDLFGHRNWQFTDNPKNAGHALLKERLEQKQDWFFSIFDVREFAPGSHWDCVGTQIHTQLVTHAEPTVAFRLETEAGTIVYTADTSWNVELPTFANNADILLADAHFSGYRAPGGAHMTPQEAGKLARLAKADMLVLCHLASALDAHSAVRAASTEFDGTIKVAVRDRNYRL